MDGGTVSIRQELEWWDMCDSGTAIVIMMSFKQALERCNIQDSGAFIVIMMFIRTVTFHGFLVLNVIIFVNMNINIIDRPSEAEALLLTAL